MMRLHHFRLLPSAPRVVVFVPKFRSVRGVNGTPDGSAAGAPSPGPLNLPVKTEVPESSKLNWIVVSHWCNSSSQVLLTHVSLSSCCSNLPGSQHSSFRFLLELR